MDASTRLVLLNVDRLGTARGPKPAGFGTNCDADGLDASAGS